MRAIERACRLIERSEQRVDLAELAAEAGLSPYHFHRLFRRATGVTPLAWQKSRQMARVGDALHACDSITEAFHAAGFGSSGRFYENAGAMLGMSPGAWRAHGRDEVIRYAVRECALGRVVVAATARGVCMVEFGESAEALEMRVRQRFRAATFARADAEFGNWLESVLACIEAPADAHALPLDIRGTAFQQRVWQALREIPIGTTASYSEIAAAVGSPRGARAVARACASNAAAVVVPCHRVIRGDGDLGGYRWGIERKKVLLARERE
jgi:AraC family transcriptional regulator of adaptative response/methylated-DNA-[protein]-cysteine methyltransferase